MNQPGKMPVVFVGHGSPMNAIEDNEFSQAWAAIAAELPTPRAVLCISAHWETSDTFATADEHPRTIHDFYGFPRELNEKQYPANGSSWLVGQVKKVVKSINVKPDLKWGLDHGAWSVLCRMYPAADIPVVQLSLNRSQPEEFHYQLGKELNALRSEGVLVLGSGNLVHNLRIATNDIEAYDWAAEYDGKVRDWIVKGDHDQVIHHERYGKAAALAVNSAEHYLPLLYVLGASETGEKVKFYAEKVVMGAISMRCVRLG